MFRYHTGPFGLVFAVFILISTTANVALAQSSIGEYQGTSHVVKFDRSPALRNIPPILVRNIPDDWGSLMVDPSGIQGTATLGPQNRSENMQSKAPIQSIPAPLVSFDSIPNISLVVPPDPVGDVGPNHYMAMSNLAFEVYDKTGASLFGPAANNTLWSGFGGECESQNAGDPIILYDQFADRWLFTQFTGVVPEAGTGEFYNCVALSETSDPTGPWFRWQVANNGLFPDYPKYGVGEQAYYISTRDFNETITVELGVTAYAMDRTAMIAGNPNPTIISFFVDRIPATDENIGNGILPMDVDGDTWPPDSTRHYYFGTMDDGGPLGASQDAITVWEFTVDFSNPPMSSFVLTDIVPVAPFDTMLSTCVGRNCVPQPDTTNRLDHQGFRQRPLHRAAYRNFGTHESIVTNQSIEANAGMSGIQWWELRSPGSSPTIFQQGTFAPGNTDGIHRWFGSVAMDSSGNIGLGYSASSDTLFPSIRYSGRLDTDPLGTMPQGEGEIVAGTGSQTGGGQRWGDYSSMNIDPVDDCTFWYITQYVPVTSERGWRLRVGSFKFDECGEQGFTLSVSGDESMSICQADDAIYDLDIGSIMDFDMPVSLSSTGEPAGTTASFNPNPVTPLPGTSTFTISKTDSAVAGDYMIELTGMATGADNRTANVELTVFDAVPSTPTLTTPPDDATGTALNPTFEWTGMIAEEYTIELATDEGFGNIIWTETTSETSITLPFFLDSDTSYYWQVSAANACGFGSDSQAFSFTTQTLPGDCGVNEELTVAHLFDFEDGAQGWVSGSNIGTNTWALSSVNPAGGTQHWHTDNIITASDTFLTSPSMTIPSGLTNLTFRFFNFQSFETPNPPNCQDGGMLEVSTNGGTDFVEVVNDDLLNDSYDGPLEAAENPLQGRQAWCGAPQPYTDSRVDISSLAGENDVVFRFRVGTDSSAGGPGWDIDDVAIAGCSPFLDFDDGFETIDP